MEDRLRRAFDAVRADEALKAGTVEFLDRRAARRASRRLIPTVACVLVLALALGGCGAYYTPTATVTFTVNPAVELGVNCFDRVVRAEGVNADGADLLTGVSVKHLDYREALERLMEAQPVARLLAEEQTAYIDVTCANEARQAAMVEAAETCSARHGRVTCTGGRYGQSQSDQSQPGQGNHTGQGGGHRGPGPHGG